MCRRIILSLLLFIFLPLYADEMIYQWKDDQGITHYSDQKHQGAQVIKLPDTPVPTETSVPLPLPPQEPAKPEVKEHKHTSYKISIIAPLDQDTVSPGDRESFSVTLHVAPELSSEDIIQILVDDSVVQSSSMLKIALPNLDRGEHNLYARIITKASATNDLPNVLCKSEKVKIYVLQPSILQHAEINEPAQQLSLTPNQMQRIRTIMKTGQ